MRRKFEAWTLFSDDGIGTFITQPIRLTELNGTILSNLKHWGREIWPTFYRSQKTDALASPMLQVNSITFCVAVEWILGDGKCIFIEDIHYQISILLKLAHARTLKQNGFTMLVPPLLSKPSQYWLRIVLGNNGNTVLSMIRCDFKYINV